MAPLRPRVRKDVCDVLETAIRIEWARSDGGVIPPIAERKTWVCTVLWLPQRTITDVQRLTGDTAEGEDASVSTFAPTDNLRLRKAPICLVLSGNKPCELECANPQ